MSDGAPVGVVDGVVSVNGVYGLLGSVVTRLHGHHFARSYCHAGIVSCFGCSTFFFFSPKVFAKTIQLPATCFKGFGRPAHTPYEPKHTATPTPIVMVGET